MMAQMSKEINGNFNLKYKRRSTSNRRSGRNTSPIPILDNQSISLSSDSDLVSSKEFTLSNHIRCYVEEYMTLGVGSSIIVLVPTSELKEENTIWKEQVCSDVKCLPIQFTKKSYLGYGGIVNTNPILSNVKNGMHVSDYESGFNNHNYGCNVKFDSESISILIIITWSLILLGKTTGVQVWRSSDGYRDVYSNFADRSKTTQGLTTLLNALYGEMYGDWLQCLYLLNCFNMAMMKNQNKSIKDYQQTITAYVPVVLEGEDYDFLLQVCNTAFGLAIKKCYTDFVVIGNPIIGRDEVNLLVNLYKSKMSNHFTTFHQMLGLKQKEGLTRNKHLKESGYYNCQVFYIFLAMSRQRNLHKMSNWAIISAGANYGRGLGEIVNRRATYLGASSCARTFIRTVKPHAESMIYNITKKFSGMQKSVWMMDNNQKGHPKKFQIFGSSNHFVKVTGRTIRNCILCQDSIGEAKDKRVPVTYLDQKIMNPINFPIFEKENVNMMNIEGVNKCLLRSGPFDGLVERLDLTGNRVHIYTELIDLTNTIQFTVLKMLIGYVASKDKYKCWRRKLSSRAFF